MPHWKLIILLTTASLLCGCKIQGDSKVPQRWPGSEAAPPESVATIHESSNVFLREVDGVAIKKNIFHRVFEIPAGPHLLSIYAEKHGFDSEGQMTHYSVGLYNIHADLKAGHTYRLGDWQYIVRLDDTLQPAPAAAPKPADTTPSPPQ